MAGEPGDLERLVVFPWPALPPELQGQFQSGYSLELWKHLGGHRGMGAKGGQWGSLPGERNKVPTGLGVELEVLAEIQVRHKQTTRKDLVSWRLSSGNFTF